MTPYPSFFIYIVVDLYVLKAYNKKSKQEVAKSNAQT